MAETTVYYGMQKPLEEEKYNIGVFNANMDVIDSALNRLSNTIDYNQDGQNNALSNHNVSDTAHNDIRNLINALATRLNTLADSDDTTLDQMSEIVSYIKSNKDLINIVTINKVNVSDIIDDLVSTDTDKPLSANQGKIIKDLIDSLTPTATGNATAAGLTKLYTGTGSNTDGSMTQSAITAALSKKSIIDYTASVPTSLMAGMTWVGTAK